MRKTATDGRKIAPNRLKDVLREAGHPQEWLAEQLGVHWQTVNRWANSKPEITWSQAVEIAQVLDIDPLAVFAPMAALRRIRVAGALQAGVWTEGFDWPDEDCYEIGIPDRREYDAMMLYGAEVRGESMNQIYPPGTIVVIERRTFGPRDLLPGSRYHVEIQRRDATVENTLKRVKASGDGRLWLIPESDDPSFQAPIQIDATNGEHVSAVGRVIYSLRAENFGR